MESICVVDGDGVRGRDQARAPGPLAELLRRQVATQELTVEAAVTGDRRAVHAAFAVDPLAGRGDLRDTEAMVEELLAGTARWLPQFAPDPVGVRYSPNQPAVWVNRSRTVTRSATAASVVRRSVR